MKKTSIITVALLLTAMIPAIQQVHAATQTIDGVISDTMCGRNHMIQGKTDAECIAECKKGGKVGYALLTSNKIYILAGKSRMFAPFAGKQVHIEGSVKDDRITVTSIHETKSEMPPMSPDMQM